MSGEYADKSELAVALAAERDESWARDDSEQPAEPEPASPPPKVRSVLPNAGATSKFLESDGMSPLRQHVITQSKPFKCSLEGGNVHVIVDFAQGYQGCGAGRYDTGEIYVGEYMAGERYGKGTFRHANGQTLVSNWKDNRPVGEGVQWSADHKKAARLKNGVPVGSLTLEAAGELAAQIGIPVPSDWMLG